MASATLQLQSATRSAPSLGFTIPADNVAKVAKSLIENGYVADRPAAGITIVDLTDSNKAMQYGVSLTGVYIQDVTGSNAKKAGLQKGDLVYYINDVKVTDSAVLLKEIQKHKIGDTVTFTVVRDGDILKYDVKLQAAANTNASSGTKQNANN